VGRIYLVGTSIHWGHNKRAGLELLNLGAARQDMDGFPEALAGTGLHRRLPMQAECLGRNFDPAYDEYEDVSRQFTFDRAYFG
jgi:hypothetical protein